MDVAMSAIGAKRTLGRQGANDRLDPERTLELPAFGDVFQPDVLTATGQRPSPRFYLTP